ncbi:MAG: hypothetical protein J5809_09045 [Selenomonadaceae bacterium]|nr:hypothetical protein [Selenomonadaceae bacterium]
MLITSSMTLTNFENAAGSPVTEGYTADRKNYQTLKVGYVVNIGFMSEDRSGHTMGYGYEYMEFLENYIPCEFEYVVFDDWTDLLDKPTAAKLA